MIPHLLRASQTPDQASERLAAWLRGLAAMGDERWDEAIAAFQRFMEKTPAPEERRTGYQNLSACYLAQERYNEALTALAEAERYAPDEPEIFHARGITYGCAARFPEAIAAFELFSRRWPRLARQRGILKIIRQLRRAQQGKIPAGTYLVDYLQEQIKQDTNLGDFAVIERKARRMIAADPTRPEGHFALGVGYVEQGRYPEALESFLAAHTHESDYEPTLYNIGHTYLKLGQPEEAIGWLERARQRKPKNLATLHELGLANERLGRRDEAVGWWRRALNIDPNYNMVQQRLHEIGAGPEPAELPLPPSSQQFRAMLPLVKARMQDPKVLRVDEVTLTYDDEVGFALEDSGNARNMTLHAGHPFRMAPVDDENLLDLIGMVKLLVRLMDAENTRDVAILIYYADQSTFNYQARFDWGKRVELDAHGRFIATEVPRFFKLRVDSDLVTPYGDPLKGKLIYLNQRRQPGILLSTLGLEAR